MRLILLWIPLFIQAVLIGFGSFNWFSLFVGVQLNAINIHEAFFFLLKSSLVNHFKKQQQKNKTKEHVVKVKS